MNLVSDGRLRYRMPVSFGPMPGPRQRVGGGRYDNHLAHIDVYASGFLTSASAAQSLLPPGLVLDGEPVVTVEFSYMREIQWLAGRGYNTLGVKIPARYEGSSRRLRGSFLAVLWENKADPIITGRDELGYAKVFCDIHPPQVIDGQVLCTASWEGHRFLELELNGLSPTAPEPAPPTDGTLHYRYVPRVGCPGETDFEGVILTPTVAPAEVMGYSTGSGDVRFLPSTWEQLPTLVHIVEALGALPILERRGATFRSMRRDIENAGQCIVD
ncbi:MAG: acetoacetate decarboxylase family protein [Mesorhizobium sp.]|nr:acetoacetate decarboxylase family protein [Mesorhizobium sp.]MCO5162240.1 acetoacetate decarboxylase family protein [Mesorhizobium sp.]